MSAAVMLAFPLCLQPLVLQAQMPSMGPIPANIQPNGMVMKLPLKQKTSRKSGLAIEVDTRWANGYGYRPIHVTVTTPNAMTSDRSVTIRLHAGWWSRTQGQMTVEQDFDLPAGSMSANTQISLPQYRLALQFISWEVWIDGVRDNDLSLDEVTAMTTMGGSSPNMPIGLSMLAVGPTSRQRQSRAPTTQEFQVLSLPIGEFPVRWIDYTSFDIVAIDFSELRQLASSNPYALTAICRWVRTGGHVWVGNTGEDWKRLNEVADIFVLRGPLPSDQGSSDRTKETTADDDSASKQRPTADEQTPLEGWQPIRLHGREQEDQSVTFVDRRTGTRHVVAYEPKSIARLQNDPNYVTVAQGSQGEMGIEDDNSRPLPPDSGEWFVQHALGLGGVRAFRGPWDPIMMPEMIVPNDADGGSIELTWRLPPEIRMSLRTVRNWTSRHGLAPDQASQDFADFLVPGVGLAPVTEFRVFITLFVLLIGPFNYWLLKRLGRLHLLVLTVPLAAALMTGSLFAYAILSDGFRTSVRVRSLTTLDQRTGEAACWAWLSYYSGLAPAQGFTFPSDVAVYPIIPDWYDTTTDADMGTTREVLWEPNAGRYTRGWLRSRTPTQYLTVRARQSPQRIEFVPVKDKLRATNELGTTIRYLVALDGDRKLFVAEHIRPGEKVILQPTERNEAISRIRQFLLENPPKAPAALAGNDSDFAIFERSWRQQSRSGLARSAVRLSDNLLNRALAESGGLGGSPALQLTPKSYIAITETGPEVAIGLKSFLEAASFHVVIGDW